MRIKAKRAAAVVCSVAMFAAVPAAPAVAGGGGGGGKKAGSSQKVGPNQCRNQKGIQVNIISCNNVDLDDGLL